MKSIRPVVCKRRVILCEVKKECVKYCCKGNVRVLYQPIIADNGRFKSQQGQQLLTGPPKISFAGPYQ